MGGPIPKNIYAKSEFRNIIFAEFEATLDRNTAVALLRSANIKRGMNTVWASPDREPAERAARNFCFGLKHILKNDLDNQYIIRVSEEFPFQVHVGGQLALTVCITGTTMERIWEGEWKTWDELHKHPKLMELTQKCDQILQRARAGMKGSPKGSSKGHNNK